MPPDAEVVRQVLAMPVVREGVDAVAKEVTEQAHVLAHVRAYDLGTYSANIIQLPPEGPGAIVRAEDPKSRWLEEGTGIYGPTGRPIRPVRGKFLVFKVKTGETIFARSVKGRPASHVMRDASKAVAARLGLHWTDHTL